MRHSSNGTRRFPSWLLTLTFALATAGCGGTSYFRNAPIEALTPSTGYRAEQAFFDPDQAEVAVVLSFSGGGSRASALAYGVLEELARHRVTVRGQTRRLLDEVDLVYGVSGGAVTAAYYGAYGDRIFTDFVPNFLSVDFQWALGRDILNPAGLTKLLEPTIGRGDFLQERLDQVLFKGITFGRMKDRPRVVLGATDLSTGARFEFTQNYFDLLCSDLSTFPVARAVAASVPARRGGLCMPPPPPCPCGWRRSRLTTMPAAAAMRRSRRCRPSASSRRSPPAASIQGTRSSWRTC